MPFYVRHYGYLSSTTLITMCWDIALNIAGQLDRIADVRSLRSGAPLLPWVNWVGVGSATCIHRNPAKFNSFRYKHGKWKC